MQKDRFQKFSLNNSSSYIDYKRKSLQPQFSDFKRSNSKLYLNKVTNNIYGDDLNNNKNEEKKMIIILLYLKEIYIITQHINI